MACWGESKLVCSAQAIAITIEASSQPSWKRGSSHWASGAWGVKGTLLVSRLGAVAGSGEWGVWGSVSGLVEGLDEVVSVLFEGFGRAWLERVGETIGIGEVWGVVRGRGLFGGGGEYAFEKNFKRAINRAVKATSRASVIKKTAFFMKDVCETNFTVKKSLGSARLIT